MRRILSTLMILAVAIIAAAQSAWTYSPEKYRDMKFMSEKMDTATVVVRIENYAKEWKLNAIQIFYTDPFTDEDVLASGNVKDNGTCVVRIAKNFPGFVTIDAVGLEVFVAPGDTLEVSASLSPDDYEGYFTASNVTFKASGKIAKDVEDINKYVDVVAERLGVSMREMRDKQSEALNGGADALVAFGHEGIKK